MVFRDWKASLEAIGILSGLSEEKLALYAWMSLRGEAKDAVRHLTLSELNSADGKKKLLACLTERYENRPLSRMNIGTEDMKDIAARRDRP